MALLQNISKGNERLLMLAAGSICKDFSSMGDGKRLVGKHVAALVVCADHQRCKLQAH